MKYIAKNKKKTLKAFTVLELLVVIAIIGLLSMITLMSLSSATFRSRDTKTIQQLSQIPSALSLIYASEGEYNDACLDEDNFSIDSGLRDIQLELSSRNKTIKCFADGDNYCISSQLNNGNYYLVKNDLRFTDEEGCTSATIGGGLGEGNVAIIPWACGDDVTFLYNGSLETYGTIENITTNECWLDRNLGATRVAQSSTDSEAYGHLFQWGRLDDGHQLRTSLSTTTRSSTDTPGHNRFITYSSSPYDWRNPQNGNLWQGVNGINNPCPEGFRIPTETEWETERLSWSSSNSAGAFASLKLTLAGLRYELNGVLDFVGSDGWYWSSTVSSTNSTYSLFDLYTATTNNTDPRAYGFTVRCIKD